MARTLTSQRFHQVVAGAARTFARMGFDRTRMEDIAAEAGVATGTPYRYAPGKEQLFELALRYALGVPLAELWRRTRARQDFPESIYDLVRTRMVEPDFFPSLRAALVKPQTDDAALELRVIAGELFDVVSRFHLAIRMVDRSTHDWPELAGLYVGGVRAPLVRDLIRYLRARVVSGAFPAPPDLAVAARFVVETCAVLAMHRHFTPGGDYASDTVARDTALHFIVAGIAGEHGG